MSTIGERIREKRIQVGFSVDELAEKLGKNRATVYRYESDEIENFPTSIIGPLAQILQTTPAYLMGWEDNNFSWEAEFRHRMQEYLQNTDAADVEAAGVDLGEIQDIIERKKQLSLESACDIADQFGLSIDHLVGRDGFEIGIEKPVTISDDRLTAKKRALVEKIKNMDDSAIDAVNVVADALIARQVK